MASSSFEASRTLAKCLIPASACTTWRGSVDDPVLRARSLEPLLKLGRPLLPLGGRERFVAGDHRIQLGRL